MKESWSKKVFKNATLLQREREEEGRITRTIIDLERGTSEITKVKKDLRADCVTFVQL